MTSMENIALWHERDISHSSTERIILPDSCLALDYALSIFTPVMSGLKVYPENMRKNLDRLGGLYREILEKEADREGDVTGRLKKRRDALIEEYRKIRLNPSYKSIASFLGIPIGTVSTSIARMKKTVRIVLQEMRHEEMSF